MKVKVIILFVTLFVFSQITFAQAEPKEPREFENARFEFDFQNFLGMNEEDEKELLKNLKKDLQDELRTIKNVDKEKYFELLRESQFKSMHLPFMEKREKVMLERENEIFEAEIKAEALAAKYEKSKESEKSKIKSQLKSILSNLFEQKEERRKEEVESLQEELVELKKSLAARQRNKNQITERRLQELLEEEEYLEWD